MLLYDLDYFNLYIKKTIKKVMNKKEEKKKCIEDFQELDISEKEA